MVSALALTAAPLDAAPRPVLAMALVRAFWNELLAPAIAVADAAAPPAVTPALGAALLGIAPLGVAPRGAVVLVGAVEFVVPRVAVPEPGADKLVVCVPLAAPAAVLM